MKRERILIAALMGKGDEEGKGYRIEHFGSPRASAGWKNTTIRSADRGAC